MKKFILLSITIMFYVNSYAQTFEATNYLDKTSFEIINVKNDDNSKLKSVENITNGFNMHYMKSGGEVSQIYYFNRLNKCYAYREIMSSNNSQAEISNLKKNGLKLYRNNSYRHDIIDLVATIIVDGDLMSIDYTRKPTIKK